MQVWQHVNDAVETTVSSRGLLEITVTVELEGDHLTVTLDDDANVVDIDQTTDVARLRQDRLITDAESIL